MISKITESKKDAMARPGLTRTYAITFKDELLEFEEGKIIFKIHLNYLDNGMNFILEFKK